MMQMEPLMFYTQIQRQYSIIGRIRVTSSNPPAPFTVMARLAQLLHPHIRITDIDYISPNYVIVLHQAEVQTQLLSEPTIHTEEFDLDMIPWNNDHELNLLPWIPGTIIDPSDRA